MTDLSFVLAMLTGSWTTKSWAWGFKTLWDESVMLLADMGLTGKVSLNEWRW